MILISEALVLRKSIENLMVKVFIYSEKSQLVMFFPGENLMYVSKKLFALGLVQALCTGYEFDFKI